MWRFLDGVSEPKKKKLSDDDKKKYYNEYDKTKRSRSFLSEWTRDRPWLENTDDGMKCTFCVAYETKKTSFFVQGTKSYKLETIKLHENSKAHQRCRAIHEAQSKPTAQSQAAKVVQKLNDENFKKMVILFRNAHALAINNRPFSDFTWMCELDAIKSLNIGETYRNKHAAKTFVSYIAKSEMNDVSSRLSSSKFICVIGDGSTDSSVKEQEMWYLRTCQAGMVTTDFIGVDSCEKATAENIVTGLKDIFESNVKINWLQLCKKMVCLSCDGASVMLGSKGGVSAILKRQQPALVTIHCMAHRLELSLKDATKSVKLFDKSVNVLAMGLYYFYHNSNLNRSMLKRSATALQGADDHNLLLPTRVGGTRWIGHTALALQHLTISMKYILAHLGQLTETTERVSVDARAKAKAFLKLLQTKSVVYFIYFLMDVLAVLKRLSLGVQDRLCLISQQHSTLESVVEVLRGYISSDGPNLRSALSNKFDFELKGNDQEFLAARRNLISGIEAALLRRFAEFSSLGVIKASRIADIKSWPKSYEPLKEFGSEDLLTLIEHFHTILEEAGVNCNEIEMEWTMLKKDMSENSIQFDSWKDVNDVYGHQYKNILDVMDLISTMSPSSAEAERGFSVLKLLKTKIRSNLSQGSLNDLLITKLHAPRVEQFDPSDAIYLWHSDGNRTRRVNFKDKQKKPDEFIVQESDQTSVNEPAHVRSLEIIDQSKECTLTQPLPDDISPVHTIGSDTPIKFAEASTQTIANASCCSCYSTRSMSSSDKYYSDDEDSDNDYSDIDSDLGEDVVFSKLLGDYRD